MTSYQDLVAQKEEIEQRIEQLRKVERANALSNIKQLVTEFNLTPQDVFGAGVKVAMRRNGAVAPKYRDAVTGKTWTGRGITPNWLKDKDRDDYLINK